MKYSAKYCMDVYGGIKSDNAPIIMWPCHKGPNQKFSYSRKTKQIKSRYSNKCLDVGKNGSIEQQKCNPHRITQKWKYQNKKWKNGKNCMKISKNGIHLVSSKC